MIARRRRLAPLPRAIWLLGLTSLFMDASSEIVHAVLPLFLIGPLGASNLVIGLIDGAVEAVASLTKVYSGALSDKRGKRKRLAAAGYGLSALSKAFFPLADTAALIFLGRFVDRLGKGIRGAPRDALIADWITPDIRGYAYGMRQAIDNVGAVIGPCLAILLLSLYPGDYSAVLWWALLPALLSVSVIGFGVADAPSSASSAARPRPILNRAMLARLGGAFWLAMALLIPLLAARCTEAFLILRALGLGVAPEWSPLALVAMNLVAVPVTPLAGIISDRIGRRRVILAGFLVLALAHGALAAATTPSLVWVGAALWGAHLGLTQGVFAALIADRAPDDLRGTAFGVYHLVSGTAILLGSILMGWGWDQLGAPMAHSLAIIAILLFLPGFIRAARR